MVGDVTAFCSILPSQTLSVLTLKALITTT